MSSTNPEDDKDQPLIQTEEDLRTMVQESSKMAPGYGQTGAMEISEEGENKNIAEEKTEFNVGVTEGAEKIYAGKYTESVKKIMKNADKVGWVGDKKATEQDKRYGHLDIYERLIFKAVKSKEGDMQTALSELFTVELSQLVEKYGVMETAQMLNSALDAVKTFNLTLKEQEEASAKIQDHIKMLPRFQKTPKSTQ